MLQIVIPAYNEERRLPGTLRALRDHVLAQPDLTGRVEVVVVDNASTDATAAVASAAHSSALPVRVVACPTPGKGAAVRAGVAATTAPVVAYLDADGATRLDALTTGVALVRAGVDVAVGSRAAPGAETTARHSPVRAWGAALYRRCTARVVPGIRDTQCGFKVMRGEAARSLLGACRTDGFSFDVELLARAARARRVVVEFPVAWTDVAGSTFHPVRHGLRSFLEVAGIAVRLRGVAVRPVAPVVPLRGVPRQRRADAPTGRRAAGSPLTPGLTGPAAVPVALALPLTESGS